MGTALACCKHTGMAPAASGSTAASAVRDAGWDVFRCVLKSKGLVAHQTESFDRFCNSYIPTIIGEFPEVESRLDDTSSISYVMHNPILGRPMQKDSMGGQRVLLPHEARLRNLTYAGRLDVDVTRTWRQRDREPDVTQERWHLCDVPVMVGSQQCNTRDHETQDPTRLNECELDAGGYFIVGGAEKVVLAQERLVSCNAAECGHA